jgi:polyisoprenoid-binding protein YceI
MKIFLGVIFAQLVMIQAMAAVSSNEIKAAIGQSQVEFLATGRPSSLKIQGEGDAATGEVVVKDGNLTGELRLALNSLKTGIKMRDEHLKEKYLEVSKYPTAQLNIKKMTVPTSLLLADGVVEGVPFDGELTLHGVTKPVHGVSKLTRSGSSVQALVEFALHIGEFAINTPQFAGITVADEVKVSANVPKTELVFVKK